MPQVVFALTAPKAASKHLAPYIMRRRKSRVQNEWAAWFFAYGALSRGGAFAL